MAKHGFWQTVCIRWLTGYFLFFATASAANPEQRPSASTGSVAVAEASVKLSFAGARLHDAMAEVSRRSAVPILVSPGISDLPVEVKLQGDDWHAVLRAWLRDFDHLAIVDRAGQYRKIWITARMTGVSDAPKGGAGRSNEQEPVDHSTEPDEITELPLAIWEPLDPGMPTDLVDANIPSAPVQMDTGMFDAIEIGQPIEIPIPQEDDPVFGVVAETHSQLNGEIQVWSGPVDGSHETASFTISRGEIATYVTVATGTEIYEVTLDNTTGLGTVVNEVDLTKGKTEKDFIIPKGRGDNSGADSL